MSARERVTLTLDPAVLSRIDQVAQARDESRSATIERVLRNGVAEEERVLDTIGEGVEGRIIAFLLQSPQALTMLAKAVGEELDPEQLAKLKTDGPGVVAAGRRYRSYKKKSKEEETQGGEA
jgi:hypothetical protein